MASFKISLMALAASLPATLAQSSDSVPSCLTQCLTQTTQPCTPASLPLLINCINSQCQVPGNSTVSSATTANSMTLTYLPKKKYSCQQSFVPGSSEETANLQLTGDGTCQTSPYDFQSLFISADDDTDDDDGATITLSTLARQCTMNLYADEGCKGEKTELDLGDVQGDKCIFQGGRSARLTCSPLTSVNTPSDDSIISSLCSGPNGTSPTGNSTTSPQGHGNGGATNATSSSTHPPMQTSNPYTGRASGDQVAKPSLIALVALFAVAVLVL